MAWRSGRLLVATVVALGALSGAASGTPSLPAEPNLDCHQWMPLLESLPDAIDANPCVRLPEGEFELTEQIRLRPDRQVVGWGRDLTVLRARRGFRGAVAFASHGAQRVRVAHLTIDMGGVGIAALSDEGMTIEHVRLSGSRCYAVGVAGPNMVVRHSIIERNGMSCPVAPPGAGIYVSDRHPTSRPVFEDNVVKDNTGPGLDVNRASGGRFVRNTVTGNSGWAAISLYGSSDWTVADNEIDHPKTSPRRDYHPFCDPGRYAQGPGGRGPAAIFLCHDTDFGFTVRNRVTGNRAVSAYGLLSIGADDTRHAPRDTRPWWVPRRNVFRDNETRGSRVGCADDLRPGQWYGERNTWSGNDCRGRAGTGPMYF